MSDAPVFPTGAVATGGQPTITGYDVLEYKKERILDNEDVKQANGAFRGRICFEGSGTTARHKITMKLQLLNTGTPAVPETDWPHGKMATVTAYTAYFVESYDAPKVKGAVIIDLVLVELTES